MLNGEQKTMLENKARYLRVEILKMLHKSQSGHTGGSLSAIDMMTVLYYHAMKHDANQPELPERDRFVLSKGHAAPALYACLADCGYFPMEDLQHLRQLGSHLQGHPDKNKTPGVEVCTGSLGQGFSQAVGLALAGRVKKENSRVFCLLGDGELQEGLVWEAAMAASHYGLDNLCAMVDYNGLQIDGEVSKVMEIAPLPEKFSAFGWHVVEIDGHDMAAIDAGIDEAASTSGKPTVLIARTVKGKGVDIFENKASFHGVTPNDDELAHALKVLQG